MEYFDLWRKVIVKAPFISSDLIFKDIMSVNGKGGLVLYIIFATIDVLCIVI